MPHDYVGFAEGLLYPAAPVPVTISDQRPRRYAVYRNNVTTGLVKAMEANFPAVQRLLGEAYFAGFGREYARANPPHSRLLFEYGGDFPVWIEAAADLAPYPYLADVARLEILWREAYHAADAAVLDGAALAGVPATDLSALHFTSHPALRLFQSRWAALSIFEANRGEGAGTVNAEGPQHILISRAALEVEAALLSASAYCFTTELAQGASMSAAAEAAASAHDDFDLASTLALLLKCGAFHHAEVRAP